MTALCIECSAALTPDRVESFWCGLADDRHSYLLTPSSPASTTGAGSQASEVCAAPNQGEQL